MWVAAPSVKSSATYRRPRVQTERLVASVLGTTVYYCGVVSGGTQCCDKPCNPALPCPFPHQKVCP